MMSVREIFPSKRGWTVRARCHLCLTARPEANRDLHGLVILRPKRQRKIKVSHKKNHLKPQQKIVVFSLLASFRIHYI